MSRYKSKRREVTRTGKLIGGFVPKGVSEAIKLWVDLGHERSASTFLREAAREKLEREGIPFKEEVS